MQPKSGGRRSRPIVATMALLALIAGLTAVGAEAAWADNLVANPGFENASVGPWTTWQSATVTQEDSKSGESSMRLSGEAASEQVITGLTPDSNYVLSGWGKVSELGGEIAIVAKGYDGGSAQTAKGVTATGWTMVTLWFRTGPTTTSATISCYHANKPGVGYCDDFEVIPLTESTPEAAPPPPALPPPASDQDPKPLGIAGDWDLVFSDEFNGDTLNLQDWCPTWVDVTGCDQIAKNPNPATELQAYDPAQVSVSDGTLKLAAIASPVTVKDINNPTAPAHTYPYRSGMIQTNGPDGSTPMHEFTFGAFEAQIYLPTSGNKEIANWPAFWVTGQDWPKTGELDIMEGIQGQAHYAFHGPGDDGSGIGGFATNSAGDFTGWHTFGARWERGAVHYYYDGVNVGTVTINVTDSPLYLILNNAIGGAGGVPLVPATMEVNYVRVWSTPADQAPAPNAAGDVPWAWIIAGVLVENLLLIVAAIIFFRRFPRARVRRSAVTAP